MGYVGLGMGNVVEDKIFPMFGWSLGWNGKQGDSGIGKWVPCQCSPIGRVELHLGNENGRAAAFKLISFDMFIAWWNGSHFPGSHGDLGTCFWGMRMFT